MFRGLSKPVVFPILPLPAMLNSPTSHTWSFFRSGGLDQVSLTTADDLSRWTGWTRSCGWRCPVRSRVSSSTKTLALIDSDGDGHIRVPEVIAAVNWAAARLKNPAVLLQGADSLPLEAIDDTTLDGKTILACAKQILASLGKAGSSSIFVSATEDTSKLFASSSQRRWCHPARGDHRRRGAGADQGYHRLPRWRTSPGALRHRRKSRNIFHGAHGLCRVGGQELRQRHRRTEGRHRRRLQCAPGGSRQGGRLFCPLPARRI